MSSLTDIVNFIKELYKTDNFIPLHEPSFGHNEKKYLLDCIDSTFVSSVGKYVDQFEEMVAAYTGVSYAIACVNGTSALHVALKVCDVKSGDLVITQALSFVATANAISYANAKPIFIDIDNKTLGMSIESLASFLDSEVKLKSDGFSYHKNSGKRISACVPMHTFGHPVDIERIVNLCRSYNITVIEDAAESMGSSFKGKMTGTFGECGVFSFNGNKIITTGGGGMIVTNSKELANIAKHLTTTAKVSGGYEFIHDIIGYNYRLPNINAALGCAQMEVLEDKINKKRELAKTYEKFFNKLKIKFYTEPDNSKSNYWLNAIILDDKKQRDEYLKILNENGIMSRPVWKLLPDLKMYKKSIRSELPNSKWLENRLVNIPSSPLR